MQLWRLVKTKYASSAFDGEGARLYGARWNSPGTCVAYASSNASLAVLEVLVHVENVAVLPSYSLISASIPDELIENLRRPLPVAWSASPVHPEVQAIGDEWVRSDRSLALRVPSALVPDGSNVLINPGHRDFVHFSAGKAEQFSFDSRLLR